MKEQYPGIDIAKFIFACFIPLLHISFSDNYIYLFFSQYIARLGVPFFFATSGMFLTKQYEKKDKMSEFIRFEKRVIKMLILWLLVYSPLIIKILQNESKPFRVLVFQTPAYLWYLTALIVAVVLFTYIKDTSIAGTFIIILYFVGTVMSGSYHWLTHGFSLFDNLFLTSRNGLFFALPLLYVGKMVLKTEMSKRKIKIGMLISLILLSAEITFVQMHKMDNSDCSMYFIMPIFIFFLLTIIKRMNNEWNTVLLRKMSTSIYVAQFGIISVGNHLIHKLGVDGDIYNTIIWVATIVGGIAISLLSKKVKLLKCFI